MPRYGQRIRIRPESIDAYERLHTFFVDTYLPGARETIACRDLPDGEARYAHAVRSHTTTNLTPDEIHEIGLSEVARIRGLMEQVADDSGYGGFAGYTEYLRTSPEQQSARGLLSSMTSAAYGMSRGSRRSWRGPAPHSC